MIDPKADWRIQWDGAPTVPVTINARPSLWVEEMRQKDGSILPGKHYWNLMTAEMTYSLPLWDGKMDVSLTLRDDYGSVDEHWVLKGARQVGNGKQIAIAFDGVSRIE